MHVKFGAAAIALAALLTVSCGGVTDPSKNVQDTFTGVLQPGNIIYYKVNIGNGGEYSIKITQLQPNPTFPIGIEWDYGDNCDLLVDRNVISYLNQPSLAGAILQNGTYCAAVFDASSFTGIPLPTTQNFTIVVSHP